MNYRGTRFWHTSMWVFRESEMGYWKQLPATDFPGLCTDPWPRLSKKAGADDWCHRRWQKGVPNSSVGETGTTGEPFKQLRKDIYLWPCQKGLWLGLAMAQSVCHRNEAGNGNSPYSLRNVSTYSLFASLDCRRLQDFRVPTSRACPRFFGLLGLNYGEKSLLKHTKMTQL